MKVAILAHVVDVDYVGVGEVGGGLRLTPEAHHKLAVARVLLSQQFDRDDTTQHVVAGLVDMGHTTAAHHANELVSPIERPPAIVAVVVAGCQKGFLVERNVMKDERRKTKMRDA
jgi:hypothetical protein